MKYAKAEMGSQGLGDQGLRGQRPRDQKPSGQRLGSESESRSLRSWGRNLS